MRREVVDEMLAAQGSPREVPQLPADVDGEVGSDVLHRVRGALVEAEAALFLGILKICLESGGYERFLRRNTYVVVRLTKGRSDDGRRQRRVTTAAAVVCRYSPCPRSPIFYSPPLPQLS